MAELDLNVAFREVAMRMASTLDLDLALRRTVVYLAEWMPLAIVGVGVFEPDFGAVRVLALASSQESAALDLLLALSPSTRKLAEEAWRGGFAPSAQVLQRVTGEMEGPTTRAAVHYLGMADFEQGPRMIQFLDLAGRRVATLVVAGSKGSAPFLPSHRQLLDAVNRPIALAVSNALKHKEVLDLKNQLRDENRLLRKALIPSASTGLVGADTGLRHVMELVRRVASLDVPVLLLGETGAGKDLIAGAIHQSSFRCDGPFIRVNCGAIPENLVESELFGHEKGAFTGAITQQRGRFESAQGGTIFLDEVGELPLTAQVKLLRVLQDREIVRVGGDKTIPLNIRVIAATNRDLRSLAAQGSFRQDLLYRLDVYPIVVPPLRDRKEDIPALVKHFMESKARKVGLSSKQQLAPGAIDQLLAYHWPGNVRELENVVERAMILAQGRPLRFDWLANPMAGSSATSGRSGGTPQRLDAVIASHIAAVLQSVHGKISGPGGAAEILGVHPNTLRNRMTRLHVQFGRHSDK